jgi:sugar lactone lactonase YvrE
MGTMDEAEQGAVGALCSYQGEVPIRVEVEGVTVSNDLGWSPHDKACYYTDSGARTIWVHEVSPRGGLGAR